jgi:2-oxoisovalerate dehydrogenase E2 component (dihydrolipoyl transacylase)
MVSLAAEIQRISRIARDGRLGVEDFRGATFTIGNIGSIGGGAVRPIILPLMVGIVGIGRVKEVPAFEKDEVGNEKIVKSRLQTDPAGRVVGLRVPAPWVGS